MTRRQRDLKRRLLALAGPNAKVEIAHTGGNHLRCTLHHRARCLVFYFGLAPSSKRTEYEETAFVKRQLRALTGRTKSCSI
jgi:hypothetical protein